MGEELLTGLQSRRTAVRGIQEKWIHDGKCATRVFHRKVGTCPILMDVLLYLCYSYYLVCLLIVLAVV